MCFSSLSLVLEIQIWFIVNNMENTVI
uniref:Uncharacterized protein n=1 Tax=Anguilla anguilla TaxID=7936 RepID=A0A0E9TKK1_ANGAN